MGVKVADSRCALNRGEGAPGFAIIGNDNNAVVTGELKAPWIRQDQLASSIGNFFDGEQKALRGLLGMISQNQCEQIAPLSDFGQGQIALYMREQNLRFGVLSTYKETTFPSQ